MSIYKYLISFLVIIIFLSNSIVYPNNYLAVQSKMPEVLANARLYYTVKALHSALIQGGIDSLREMYTTMEGIKRDLLTVGKVTREDIDSYRCLVFEDDRGEKAYYFFHDSGNLFRVTEVPNVNDSFARVLGLDKIEEKVAACQLDPQVISYVKLCLEKLYGEQINPEVVDDLIEETTSKRPPAWMAQDYVPGFLFMRDAPEKGSSSKEGVIKQVKAHLYKATSDPLIRRRVEKLLDILRAHPKADRLTLAQYEGIGHILVKKYSGNPNAYSDFKEIMDNSFRDIYEELRDEILQISDYHERLKAAMLYSGSGNLIDFFHLDTLRNIVGDLGIEIDLSKGIMGKDLLRIVKGTYEKITREELIIGSSEFEQFVECIEKSPNGRILYFTDNHGEVILDQLVIEQLLRAGYRITVVSRGETVRDDVTVDEAREIFRSNSYLREYLESGRLSVVTDGSYITGADLTQSEKYPEFLEAWQDSVAYIAKGGGNFHNLLGQKLSIPGFHIRMMKGGKVAYRRLSKIKGIDITSQSDYDLAFIYQYASLFDPKKLDGLVLPDGSKIRVYADRSDYPPEVLKHWDNHYAVFELTNSELGYTAYMAIHRLTRIVSKAEKINGQWRATGGTRIRNYKSNEAALADALELSQEMSFKCAGQQLAIAGSKCTINAKEKTREILISYAKAIEEIGHRIGGGVLTGQDVKITKEDADLMSEHAPTSIIPNVAPDICREPAPPTGIGVVAAIRAAVAEAFPEAPSVSGKVVAIQGAGGTGASVVKQLLSLGAIVIVSDISKDTIDALRMELTGEDRDRFYYIVEDKDGDGYTRHIMNPRAVRSFTDTLMHIDAIGEGRVDVFVPAGGEPVASQGSHIVKVAAYGEGEEVIYSTRFTIDRDSVLITDADISYVGMLRDGLKRLLDAYGPGIFTQVGEIRIVKNLRLEGLYPTGRAPLASFENGILRIDELAFKYGPELLFEELEHESLESIIILIPGTTHALADVVSTFINVKRFLELSEDKKEEFLGLLGGENPIDPDGEYSALLRRLSDIKNVTEDEIIASVVRYVLKTKLYKKVRGELDLPEELAKKIRDLEPKFGDALQIFNEIAEAKEGRELVGKVKESGRLAVRVIKTLRGMRISVTEAEQEVIEAAILSLYPDKISWVREHAKRVARMVEIIAVRMGLNAEFVRLIRIAALAHDLGKGCSEEMIAAVNSPRNGKPAIIDKHKEESLRMLEKAGIGVDDIVKQAIRYHHDPWKTDSGYARILTEIVFLADQIDATQDTNRPYRKDSLPVELLKDVFRRYREDRQISGRVYETVHRLLTGNQPDFMRVIYEARLGNNRRLTELLDYIEGYDKLILPEGPDITRPRYIVVGKDRKKNRLEDILRDKYNIHIVTEIPSDGEFVVLVDPEDVDNWKGQKLLYLPLPYMEQSLKLAAGMLLGDKEIARNYLKGFYSILLGRELSGKEVLNLFHRPWWILPEISALTTDLIILRDAISLLEKSA